METGDITRAPRAVVDGFRPLSSGTVSNALDKLRISGVMRSIKPLSPAFRVTGTAVTVWEVTAELGSAGPEEMDLGLLVDTAAAGDVVVVDNGGQAVSTWGGIATFAAKAKGLAGLVVDGGVRDAHQIEEFGFPVFARHLVPVTGKGRIKILSINRSVKVDGVIVSPGDVIVGDRSGVVCVPRGAAEEVLELARKQDAADDQVMEWVRQGLSFSEALRKAGVR